MRGHLAAPFWGALVIAGLVIPLVLDIGHRVKGAAALAAILVPPAASRSTTWS